MGSIVIDRADVQGLVVRGHPRLRAARYVLVRFSDGPGAGAWLAHAADDVDDGRERPTQHALNIALAPSGIRKLGLPERVLEMFGREFTEGMVTEHRSRILGDVDDSAPTRWLWGRPEDGEIDALVLLYAVGEARMATVLAEHLAVLEQHGLKVLRTLDTSPLVDHEHFGFRDGVSQPRLDGLGERPDAQTVSAGEFVLGYRNGYGQYTPRPLVEPAADPRGLLPRAEDRRGLRDLGRGGSYLVFRQLSQDVRSFWEYCDRATRSPDDTLDAEARVALAAKMIGRWPSGAPLVLAPDADRPELAESNDFGYHAADPDGLRCPLGAHVRRSHPRDALDPKPGSPQSVEVGNRHRLLRRGRQYGSFLDRDELLASTSSEQWSPDQWNADPRGLHFICLVGNITRQFEFVQHAWLNNPRFAGLYDDPDPLMSPDPGRGRVFTVPDTPVRRRYKALPRFVSVRGGAYFFLPGINAMRYLASLASPGGPSPLQRTQG